MKVPTLPERIKLGTYWYEWVRMVLVAISGVVKTRKPWGKPAKRSQRIN